MRRHSTMNVHMQSAFPINGVIKPSQDTYTPRWPLFRKLDLCYLMKNQIVPMAQETVGENPHIIRKQCVSLHIAYLHTPLRLGYMGSTWIFLLQLEMDLWPFNSALLLRYKNIDCQWTSWCPATQYIPHGQFVQIITITSHVVTLYCFFRM